MIKIGNIHCTCIFKLTSQTLVTKFNIKDCQILVEDIKQDPSLKFVKGRVRIPRFKYKCYVCYTRFFTNIDLSTHKMKYKNKECKHFSKIKAKKEPTKKRKLRKNRVNNGGVNADYTKDVSEDGSVFSCKHCWKVFLSKCSLQEHINWHYQNLEIDKGEVEEFYNNYALLRPDVDPFLTAEDDVQQDSVITQIPLEPIPGPSRPQFNNNTNFEANMNLGVDLDKTSLQLIKMPVVEDVEMDYQDCLFNLSEEISSPNPEGPSTLEQAVCTKQPSNLLVNREHYRCNRCDNLFLSFDSFGEHIVNEKCIIIGKCCLCRAKFCNNLQLYEHVLYRHSRFRCICNFCFKTFVSFENLQKHIIKKHHYF